MYCYQVKVDALYGRGSDVHYQNPTGNLAVLHVMLEKMHNSENYARKLEKQGLEKMLEMMNDGKIV